MNNIAWAWLGAAMIPATLFVVWRLLILDKRERVLRGRLEVFRGPIRANSNITGGSKWEQFGRKFAPIVGADQKNLLKSLAAAGFKHSGSLAIFIAIKAISAIVFLLLTWLLIEWRHLL